MTVLPDHWARPPAPRRLGVLERWISFWHRHAWVNVTDDDPARALLWNLFVIGYLVGHGHPDLPGAATFHSVTVLLWVGFVVLRILEDLVGRRSGS